MTLEKQIPPNPSYEDQLLSFKQATQAQVAELAVRGLLEPAWQHLPSEFVEGDRSLQVTLAMGQDINENGEIQEFPEVRFARYETPTTPRQTVSVRAESLGEEASKEIEGMLAMRGLAKAEGIWPDLSDDHTGIINHQQDGEELAQALASPQTSESG